MLYSVVLNSNLKSSGTNSNSVFYFDWTVLPESKYKVTGVFTSGSCDMTTLTDIAMLEVQLGQHYTYTADSLQTKALTSNCLGFLLPNSTTVSTFIYGDITTIPPLFLNNRPNSNEFFVKLKTNDNPSVFWDDAAGVVLGDYVLILTFETI